MLELRKTCIQFESKITTARMCWLYGCRIMTRTWWLHECKKQTPCARVRT